MGFYGDQIVPRLLHVACGAKTLRPLRERVCAGLRGEVVEIGFGSGANVPFYPPAVDRVRAVEPSDVAWKLAGKSLAGGGVPVERAGLDGQALPFPDDTFDSALSTWTMCSIPDPVVALQEVRRVLKPGARLHFLEHGLAPDPQVRKWQHRLDPIEKRLVGGCTFTQPIADLIRRAGFDIEEIDVFYEKGAPKFAGADSLGVAVAG
jgi:SAM-dependent methyltransferase